jgi:hypothetical protein
MEMKETFEVILVALLVLVVFVAMVVGLVYCIEPPSCDSRTEDIGMDHRWSFWGGCQVNLSDGTWIPLKNYIVNEEIK